jgi:hypothetical protein
MSGINILRRLLLKDAALGSGQASGIMSIGDSVRDLAEKRLTSYLMSAQKQGVDIDKLGEQELKYILEMNKQKSPKVIAADSPEGKGITESLFGKKGEVFNLQGEKLDPNLPISGGTQQGKKINREFFTRDAEGKDDIRKGISKELQRVQKRIDSGVAAAVERILGMKPIDAMKEANSVIGRKGIYKNLSEKDVKKILQDTEDHIFERNIDIDPEDFAEGGVAGMLGERQNFKMGRRAFLKMLAGTGAGIAGLKTGVTGLGGKKVATEVAKEAVTTSGGTPPPYFFNLVKKIKNLGDDVTKTRSISEREKVTAYKDYELTEDLTTGEQTIQRVKMSDHQYYDENLAEEVYMNYKPGKGQADEATGKVADEYIEDTGYLRTSGPQKGDLYDSEPGVPDDVIKEGTVFEDDITDFTTKKLRKKKAGGGVAYMLGQ